MTFAAIVKSLSAALPAAQQAPGWMRPSFDNVGMTVDSNGVLSDGYARVGILSTDRQTWTSNYKGASNQLNTPMNYTFYGTTYSAVIYDMPLVGNFTLIVKYNNYSPVFSMVCNPDATATDFWFSLHPDYYDAPSLRRMFSNNGRTYTSGAHTYGLPSPAFDNPASCWIKYNRTNNDLTIVASTSSSSGPWTAAASAQCGTSDKVICVLGECSAWGKTNVPATIISRVGG